MQFLLPGVFFLKIQRLVLVSACAAVVCVLAADRLLGQTSFPKQFVTPQQLTAENNQQLIGVGDLNGDGRPDILYPTSEQIATGNGTFRTVALTQTFVTGSKLADVNGDGKLDVVEPIPAQESCDYNPDGTPYCNIDSDAELVVYFGNGDGTFRSGTVLDLGQEGSGTASLTLLDLNGDGKLDAVISFNGNPEDSASADSFVLLNNGSGTFQVASTAGPAPLLASGDFNGDGKTDIAVGSFGVSILYGNGDGTFTAGPTYGSMFTSSGVAGDFNHDGRTDLAVADTTGSSTNGIYVLLGQSDGSLSAPKRISTFTAGQLAAADLNHDGYLDLIAGYTSFAVFTNLKNGTFSNPRIYAGKEYTVGPFALADFNRDGNTDLVSGNLISYGSRSGTFSVPAMTQTPTPVFVAVGDFNGDGIDDVAVVNTDQFVTVFLGSGQGYLNAGTTYPTGLVDARIAVGDVNGDGYLDLVVTRGNYDPNNTAKDVTVLMGNGDGTFRSAISTSILGQPATNTLNKQTYVIDVNHDGKGDLIGDWGVALGKGDGTFEAPTAFPPIIKGIVGIAAGDFNRDGNVDMVVGTWQNATIYTLLGDGKGNFTLSHQEKLNYTKPVLEALTTADMNGDGILDLVYLYSASPSEGGYDRVVVETNDGAGNFGNSTGQRITFNGGGYDTLLVADYNHDGKPDVVVLTVTDSLYSPTLGDSVLLRGTGGGDLGAPQYFPVQMFDGAVMNLNDNDAPDIIGPSMDYVGVERVLNTGATE